MKHIRRKKRAEPPKYNGGHAFFFLGGLFMGWLTYLTAVPALSGPYPDFWGLVFGLFFGSFSLVCFWTMFRLNKWNEIKIPKKNERTGFFQRLRPAVYFAMGAAGFGVFCFYIAYSNYQDKENEITRADLKVVKGIVAEKIKLSKGGKGSPDITIHLAHIPDFRFILSGNAYYEARTEELMLHVQPGDSLTLDVPLDDYQKKISREKPLGFWDKTVNYSFLSIYGLRDREHTYLSFYDLNEALKSEYPYMVFGFVGLGLFLFGSAALMIKLEGIWQKPKSSMPFQNR